MPVNVAVEEPGSGVVSGETDGNVVIYIAANIDDIPSDRICIVILSTSGTPYDAE